MPAFHNAARLADYLGTLYRNDGHTYRLVDGAIPYGHLDAIESDRGLEIRLLMISAGCSDRGYGMQTLHEIVEAADRYDATIIMNGYPLPLKNCQCTFAHLGSLGFHEASWNDRILERKPCARSRFTGLAIVA